MCFPMPQYLKTSAHSFFAKSDVNYQSLSSDTHMGQSLASDDDQERLPLITGAFLPSFKIYTLLSHLQAALPFLPNLALVVMRHLIA